MTEEETTLKNKIKKIFEQNKINDLSRFLKKRENLNNCNIFLVYLFHIIQSAGILSSSIAASYNNKQLLWIGVSLNVLATIIQTYEKINDAQMKRLMRDIQAIKNDNYIDECAFIDVEKNINANSAINK
jgi:hypothetical protein